LFEILQTALDLAGGFVFAVAIAFLQLAYQLVEAAIDHVKIIVGQFASPFLCLTAHLFPLFFKDIFVHSESPFHMG
jgi:hypothetical protein